MMERILTVENQNGIHARPSAAIVSCVSKFDCEIKLETENGEADGKSIMEILMLKILVGSKVKVTASGPDEEKVLDALEALFKDHFGVKE